MAPAEELLIIEDVGTDRRRRRALALVLASVALSSSALLWFRPGRWALPVATLIVVAGLALASRYELPGRARALLRIRQIRRDGVTATEKLTAGDLGGARAGFVALLPQARSLQAFHATQRELARTQARLAFKPLTTGATP